QRRHNRRATAEDELRKLRVLAEPARWYQVRVRDEVLPGRHREAADVDQSHGEARLARGSQLEGQSVCHSASVVALALTAEIREPGHDGARRLVEEWNACWPGARSVALPRARGHGTVAVGGAQALTRAAVPGRSPHRVERIDEAVAFVEQVRNQRSVAWDRIDVATVTPAVLQKEHAAAERQSSEPPPPPIED